MNAMVRELNMEELAVVSGGFSKGDSQQGQAGSSNNDPELQDDGNGGSGGGTWYDWNGDGDSWDEGTTILLGAGAIALGAGAVVPAAGFAAFAAVYDHIDENYF